MLLSLPTELVEHILFLLVAADPLAPPRALAPLLTTSRALNAIAAAASLHARIFRLMFDAAAVQRRLFHPTPTALKEQLSWACSILAAIRRGVPTEDQRAEQLARARACKLRADEVLMEDVLYGALLLMLDNDGRNYAQLEAAGVHAYVRDYLRHYIWEESEQNDGWPVETRESASALWLMWLTIDRDRLRAEAPAAREQLILAVNPFVFLPHKYPASEAPPNHFDLPITPREFKYHLPNSTSTSFYPRCTPEKGAQYYPHYLPARSAAMQYFSSNQDLAVPLASIAAKMLYVAIREVRPFMVPPHLPRTAEEARRRWWARHLAETDAAVAIANGQDPAEAAAEVEATINSLPDPLPPLPPHITAPTTLGPTQEDYRGLNRGKAAALPRGARWDWDRGCARAVNLEEGDEDLNERIEDESRKWDTLWARMQRCMDYTATRPAGGAVFDRGAMRGTWGGKIYIPTGTLLGSFIRHNPPYPGPPYFTETAIGLIMQPFFLQIEEHVRICGCTTKRKGESHRQCGVIPVPRPVVIDWTGLPFDGVLPQDLPAGHPQHTGIPPDDDFDASLHGELDSTMDRQLHMPKLDYSMSNAWIPGPIGELAFRSRPAAAGPPLLLGDQVVQRRDELVLSPTGAQPSDNIQAVCPAYLPEGAPAPTPAAQPGQYVYETYDPAKVSAHDVLREAASYTGPSATWATAPGGVGVVRDPAHPHAERYNPDCARCVEREAALQRQRARTAEKARRALELRAHQMRGTSLLDEAMSVWGSQPGTPPTEGADIEELDVRDLGLRLDGESEEGMEQAADEDEDEASVLHTVDSPCSHAADTLFTGETPPSGLAWGQQYTTYGRLRPWDGLVGLVRVGRSTTNFIFIFGYVVGGRTFVGEWRVAASDPMRPAWGGAFVMSRMEGEA